MTTTISACAEGLTRERLSAYRSGLLSADETANVRAHLQHCVACQDELARLDRIGAALRALPVPEAGERLWQRVQVGIAQPQSERRRKRSTRRVRRGGFTWSGAGAVAAALAVALLFAQVLRALPDAQRQHGILITTVAPATATPSPTPSHYGLLTVYDPSRAQDISFAYMVGADLWASLAGAAPRTIAHLNADPHDATVLWKLFWSPDASKLLVTAVSTRQTPWPAVGAWIVTIPDGHVTQLPASAPLATGCLGFGDGGPGCAWIVNRYIEYGDTSPAEPNRTGAYRIYDTAQQVTIPTVLEQERIQYAQAIRGTDIYFTPYGKAEVDRFQLETNSIDRAFTLPGPVVNANGIPGGGWDLSRNGQQLVFIPETSAGQPECLPTQCAYYLTAQGDTTPLLLSGGMTASTPRGGIAISPDGTTVALRFGTPKGDFLSLQRLPAGPLVVDTVTTLSVYPSDIGALLGWDADTPGALLEQLVVSSTANSFTIEQVNVYWCPSGTVSPPLLVESIATASTSGATGGPAFVTQAGG